MSSPAVPGLLLCFIAMVLLVFVRFVSQVRITYTNNFIQYQVSVRNASCVSQPLLVLASDIVSSGFVTDMGENILPRCLHDRTYHSLWSVRVHRFEA